MYGLPGQDAATWARSVDGVVAWPLGHLSAYGLTLDAGSLGAGGRGGGARAYSPAVATRT